MPTRWEEGPFLGNGLIGAVLHAELGRVTSLAGEPVTLKVAIREPTIAAPRPAAVVATGDGSSRLTLGKGETVTLTEAGIAGAAAIAPVSAEAGKQSLFGLP